MSLVSAQEHRRSRRPGLVDPNVLGINPIGNSASHTGSGDPETWYYDNDGVLLLSGIAANTSFNFGGTAYDGDSMTKEYDLDSPDLWFCHLKNPSTGSNQFSSTFTSGISHIQCVLSMRNVDLVNFPSNKASGSGGSVTVGSTTEGNIVVAFISVSNTTGFTEGTGVVGVAENSYGERSGWMGYKISEGGDCTISVTFSGTAKIVAMEVPIS